MIFIVLLGVFVMISYYIYGLVIPSRKMRKYGNKIPGPKPLPILGNSLIFARTENLLDEIMKLGRIYGSIYRLWIGKELFVFISNPDDIKVLVSHSKNLNKSDSYKILRPLLGETGLITADADVWRIHRKKLSSLFNKSMSEKLMPIIVENAKILIKQIQKNVDQQEFNITEFMDKFTFDILYEMTVGIKSRTQEKPNFFYNKIEHILDTLNARILQPWLQIDFIFRLSKYSGITNDIKLYRNKHKKIIDERKKLLKNVNEIERSDEESRKPMPFLDFILKKSNFTIDEILDEGQDAPSKIITFCLYELSKNQRVQDKLLEELKNSPLNKNDEPTFDDYMNLKYLDFVIKETMRLYSPAVVAGRKVDQDILLPSGYVLPANTSANIFIYNLHRQEKYFSNPNEFIPERFENMDKSYQYTYIPFSVGVRNCIGQIFSLIEVKIAVSMIMLKYRLLPVIKTKKIRLEIGSVLHPLDTINLRITSRKLL